jgi:ubiquitin-protein ligase
MVSRLCLKRLNKEISMYQKENFSFPNLILRPKENDLLTWFFIIHDLQETPFEGGIYFGKILLDQQYPLKPPNFIFITPNGRFETDKKICTTFSAYHQETYTSTWNIMSMMEGMISFMTDKNPDKGIGSLETTDEEKCRLAKNSLEWNKLNDIFISTFHDIDTLITQVNNTS